MPHLRDEMEWQLRRWSDDLSVAWRKRLGGVAADFDAVPKDALLGQDAQIVPCRRDGRSALYGLEGIDPSDVNVVMLGNDPHPDPARATGRSFEQGNLTDWIGDLLEPGRVTPGLLSLVCAAAALGSDATRPSLADPNLRGRREELRRALLSGAAVLPPPRSICEILTGQGVLWINRIPTTSAFNTGMGRRGSSWETVAEQRKWHRALWRPIMRAILSSLVDEARTGPIVFALFGQETQNLRRWIEARRRRLGVPSENVRFVERGHPSAPRIFFSAGNPLGSINDELTLCGRDRIDWYGPSPGRTADGSTSLALAPKEALGRAGTSAAERGTSASPRSIAIMDRAVGKYRKTLRQLAAL